MTRTEQALDGLPERVPVSVNGIDIPHDAIARETQYHPAPKPVAAWQAAAQALVVRELLLQEARRLGMSADPRSDEGGRRETEDEALIRGLVEQEVSVPDPDEAACRRYYEQNRSRFRSETIFEAAHILFSAREDDADAYAEAWAAAAGALEDLKRRPERFSTLARVHSACPSAEHGGNLGQITAGQTTPEFERALAELSPGEIGERPVKTRYGLHVIRLDRRIDGTELPFEAVARHIADYLRENVTRRATAQYVARLVSKADIAGIALAGAPEHRVS